MRAIVNFAPFIAVTVTLPLFPPIVIDLFSVAVSPQTITVPPSSESAATAASIVVYTCSPVVSPVPSKYTVVGATGSTASSWIEYTVPSCTTLYPSGATVVILPVAAEIVTVLSTAGATVASSSRLSTLPPFSVMLYAPAVPFTVGKLPLFTVRLQVPADVPE